MTLSPFSRGVLIALLHVLLLLTLGGKLLYDRSTRPRVWALTTPVDPDLPIRGRYVSLRLVVQSPAMEELGSGEQRLVTLTGVAGELEATPVIAKPADGPATPALLERGLKATRLELPGGVVTTLDTPVAFFIPENIPDPSILEADQELWVEVTVPKAGPPRPIRLGLRRGDDDIQPLDL
jgi:hypothetical protein